MLKHFSSFLRSNVGYQPPSGGCVLKPGSWSPNSIIYANQPPSGGCVLKQSSSKQIINQHMAQPPSGGCVLKPAQDWRTTTTTIPAAFRRLCVETGQYSIGTPWKYSQPPSGGCVLKRHFHITANRRISQPPSGGCVLKRFSGFSHRNISYRQPPSGGCVLKP